MRRALIGLLISVALAANGSASAQEGGGRHGDEKEKRESQGPKGQPQRAEPEPQRVEGEQQRAEPQRQRAKPQRQRAEPQRQRAQQPQRQRAESRQAWSRTWRTDSRYDWQRFRSTNRTHFQRTRYYAPYRSWNYRRFSIGFVLQPLFYVSRYWISDPWQYRLPPAPPGTRWIRYYSDVLLVDTYNGEVIDVIYDFFY